MAWNAPTAETITESNRTFITVLGGFGDQSSAQSTMLDLVSRETKDIYCIDLLELRYEPAASEVSDNRLVRLVWDDDSRLNDDNRHYRLLAPILQSDGSYAVEFNVPRNLFKFDGRNHRPYNQSFSLSLWNEFKQTKMATEYILCTLRVTARLPSGVEYQQRFEPVVLNSYT